MLELTDGLKVLLKETAERLKGHVYTRISTAEVRRQLIAQKGYSAEELPSKETILTRLNQLGYYPSKVGKTKPLKKLN